MVENRAISCFLEDLWRAGDNFKGWQIPLGVAGLSLIGVVSGVCNNSV